MFMASHLFLISSSPSNWVAHQPSSKHKYFLRVPPLHIPIWPVHSHPPPTPVIRPSPTRFRSVELYHVSIYTSTLGSAGVQTRTPTPIYHRRCPRKY